MFAPAVLKSFRRLYGVSRFVDDSGAYRCGFRNLYFVQRIFKQSTYTYICRPTRPICVERLFRSCLQTMETKYNVSLSASKIVFFAKGCDTQANIDGRKCRPITSAVNVGLCFSGFMCNFIMCRNIGLLFCCEIHSMHHVVNTVVGYFMNGSVVNNKLRSFFLFR